VTNAHAKVVHIEKVEEMRVKRDTSSSDIAPFKSFPGEYIYVMRTREFVRCDENVFKIGRTSNLHQRLAAYPRGSHLLACWLVADSIVLERNILAKLRSMPSDVCKARKDIGREWFETGCNRGCAPYDRGCAPYDAFVRIIVAIIYDDGFEKTIERFTDSQKDD
jgi:hypothetical protein